MGKVNGENPLKKNKTVQVGRDGGQGRTLFKVNRAETQESIGISHVWFHSSSI